jgi:PAS domain S-box-containing protein
MTHARWLGTTIDAVREVMERRLEAGSLDSEAQKEVEMALEELDVMWEELRGQAALLERETERYAEFFEYAPDAYLITDAGGNVREANRAASEMFGANLLRRSVASLVPEDDRAAVLSLLVGVLGEPGRKSTWQGSRAQYSVRAIPLRKSGVAGLCWLIRPL